MSSSTSSCWRCCYGWDDRAYGVTVRQELSCALDVKCPSAPSVDELDRLEMKGYVKSRRGDPTPERGGRSKRFFRVTAKGVTAVNRAQRALQSMTEGLNLIGSYS